MIRDTRARPAFLKTLHVRDPCAVDLRVGFLPGRAVAESRDDVEIRAAALALAAGLQRGVHVGVHGRDRTVGQHADYCEWFSFEIDALPQDIRILGKNVSP